MPRFWRRAAAIVVAIAVWDLATRFGSISPLFLPPPQAVLEAGLNLWERGILQRHLTASLTRIAQGFTYGALAGVGFGLLLGLSAPLRALLRPTLELLRPIPALVWIPLVLTWFGIGETGKIFLISYGVFFIAFTSTFDGTQGVDPKLLRAARSLGARPVQLYLKVMLPAVAPQIMTGLSIAIGTAFSVLVAAELLGAIAGLGWMITDARRFFQTEVVLLGMVVIGLLGLVCVTLLTSLRRRLMPWYEQSPRL